jgi:hypothetical protein
MCIEFIKILFLKNAASADSRVENSAPQSGVFTWKLTTNLPPNNDAKRIPSSLHYHQVPNDSARSIEGKENKEDSEAFFSAIATAVNRVLQAKQGSDAEREAQNMLQEDAATKESQPSKQDDANQMIDSAAEENQGFSQKGKSESEKDSLFYRAVRSEDGWIT